MTRSTIGLIYVVKKYSMLLAFLIQGADLHSSSGLLSRLKLISLNLARSLTTESNFLKYHSATYSYAITFITLENFNLIPGKF